MVSDDRYEADLVRQIEEARREGQRLMAEAAGMEKALGLYRRARDASGKGVTSDASGPTPPEGWKKLTRDIVDSSPRPLVSSEVIRLMALRGYSNANPKTITSTLSNLAREGAIVSDSGRYSGRQVSQETEAAGADQSHPAALSSLDSQENDDAAALAKLTS